jgi:hypothetical protein
LALLDVIDKNFGDGGFFYTGGMRQAGGFEKEFGWYCCSHLMHVIEPFISERLPG